MTDAIMQLAELCQLGDVATADAGSQSVSLEARPTRRYTKGPVSHAIILQEAVRIFTATRVRIFMIFIQSSVSRRIFLFFFT